MTTFEPVNVGLGLSDYSTEATTPTTPRAPMSNPPRPTPLPPAEDSTRSAPNTPTTRNFGGVNGQRPLPGSPFSNSFPVQHQPLGTTRPGIVSRGDSSRSIQSAESQDIDMDESDEGDGGSDTESIDLETGRPSKKKKGQRFFCTDFPPCKLSFTRSEHLARHIRKHTGERPFQCHCSRRFSRLDNLRQHAQTVHVNEEIPGDSLAATGTRFQRQIRTDRVRPPSGRARAGTAGSQGSHGPRGHSRNLSASSIGSTASTMVREDSRRRPPPLIMANDSSTRNRLTLDTLRSQTSTPPGQSSFLVEPSEGASTPTSTTYSNGQNSPGYGSSLGSPVSAVSRGGNFWDGRSHARRLSVPSGPIQFQSPQSNAYPSPFLSPLVSSSASTFSNIGSSMGSPTSATYNPSRREAVSAAEAEWRRRTWHPSSYTHTNYSRPATSGLSYYQTPDAPRPAFAPQAAAAASQPHRLPGIETFDQIPRRPATPHASASSPMHIDTSARPPIYPGPPVQPNTGLNDRKGHASWDMSLHQNLNKLGLGSGTPPNESGPWSQQTVNEQIPVGPQPEKHTHTAPILHQESQKRPSETSHYPNPTPNRAKRQGWYFGHVGGGQQRASPGDSSSSEGVPTTPSFSAAEHHPSIVHSNGYIEPAHPGAVVPAPHHTYNSGKTRPPTWPLSAATDDSPHHGPTDTQMSGLEVLVAVATSEENATATPRS